MLTKQLQSLDLVVATYFDAVFALFNASDGGTLFRIHAVGIYLLYLSLIMSVLSALEYIRFFVEAAARQAKELEEQGITRAALKEQARLRREKIRALKKRRFGVLRRRRP